MTESSSASESPRSHAGFGKPLIVGLTLLCLTTLSYLLSRLDLGDWGVVIALAIAVAKSTLVVFFFMHLSERHGGPRLVVATAIAFVIILIGLILLEASDRLDTSLPPGPFSAEEQPGLTGQPAASPTRSPPSTQTP